MNLPDVGAVLVLKMKTMDAGIVAGLNSGLEDTERRMGFLMLQPGFTENICRILI